VVKEYPIHSELKKIIYATTASGDYIRSKLIDSKDISAAFIYGSVARDEETEKSDIDLFIIGSASEEKVHGMVLEIEKDIGREINYTLMEPAEFNLRRKKAEPFIARIMAEKKIILKDDAMSLDDLLREGNIHHFQATPQEINRSLPSNRIPGIS
jgi:predicted nucleotidyltransferase